MFLILQHVLIDKFKANNFSVNIVRLDLSNSLIVIAFLKPKFLKLSKKI